MSGTATSEHNIMFPAILLLYVQMSDYDFRAYRQLSDMRKYYDKLTCVHHICLATILS